MTSPMRLPVGRPATEDDRIALTLWDRVGCDGRHLGMSYAASISDGGVLRNIEGPWQPTAPEG